MGGSQSKAENHMSKDTAKHIKAFKKATRKHAYTLENLRTGVVAYVPKVEGTEMSSILQRRFKEEELREKEIQATLFTPVAYQEEMKVERAKTSKSFTEHIVKLSLCASTRGSSTSSISDSPPRQYTSSPSKSLSMQWTTTQPLVRPRFLTMAGQSARVIRI